MAIDGRRYTLRALLDSGAQTSFLTDQATCILMLNRLHSTVNITTFSTNASLPVCGQVTISMMPFGQQSPSFFLDKYIVLHITEPTPKILIVPGKWAHVQNLSLAEPFYYRPQPVDLLLGTDISPLLFLNGRISGQPGEPTAFATVFGWILMRPINNSNPSQVNSLCVSIS